MAKQDVTVELWYSGQWNDVTADVLIRDQIVITRGGQDEQQQPPPATVALTFKRWDYNPRNPASSLHGLIGRNTPIQITMPEANGLRFVGEVSSWTPRQNLAGDVDDDNRWVLVTAAGVTRRLGQGADPLNDTVHRFMTGGAGATNLVGYWPMAGGQSERSREAVVGQPMRMTNANNQADDQRDLRLISGTLAPWLVSGTTVNGTVPPPDGLLPGQTVMVASVDSGDTTRLTLEAAYRYTSGNLENRAGHQVKIRGHEDDFFMDWFTNNFNGLPVGSGGAEETNPDWRFTMRIGNLSGDPEAWERIDLDSHNELTDGAMHVIRVDMEIDAVANELDWTVYFDGSVLDSGTVTSFTLSTFQVDQVGLETRTLRPDAIVFGHTALWAGTPPAVADSLDAFLGHAGEHAGRRIERLCDEEDVPFVGDLAHDMDDTLPMGPQYPDGLVAILHECAEVDRGLLIDGDTTLNDEPALDYRPGRDLYNQTATLELDYDAEEVAPPLDPVVDDQATRNDVAVTDRTTGASFRAVLETGPLSTAAPPSGVGRYQTSVTVNVLEGMLGDQAGWRLHLGTVDETRYPQVTVDLDATPGLASSVADLHEGDRITIDNLPADLSPDLASLVVLGWTETIGSHRRRITYNCIPESTFHIAEVEHADYAVIGNSGSFVLTEFVAGTDTTLTVHDVPDNAFPWTTDAGDVPFDILVLGVRLRVTAVSSPTAGGAQDLTVEQTPVNGVTKTIPSSASFGSPGAPVDVFHKSYIGL